MKRTSLLAAVLAGALFVSAGNAVSLMDPRTPETIVADYDAVKMPTFDSAKRGDAAYTKTYREEMDAANAKKADLALELYKAKPDHARTAELLNERWSLWGRNPEKQVLVLTETAEIAKGTGELAISALHANARTQGFKDKFTGEAVTKAVDSFIAKAPKDERGATLLSMLASNEKESGAKLAIYKRIMKDYAGTKPAKGAAGQVRRADGVGKPFELKFKDAVSGKEIDLATWGKGKVIVVDFWATWCGPCVAEMPKMKELYKTWSAKGVEFVGVSLDQPEDKGGLTKLKEYVATNEVPWVQYYQGNYWESEFSTSWGINSIPCIFIVDKDGKLHTTEGRGKLEELLPKLTGEGGEKK